MRAPRPALAAVCLSLLGGCAGMVFTEADGGQTRDVARGTEFSVSLPAIPNSPRSEPKIQGAFIRFLQRRSDDSREVFEFRADGLGQGDIRIPAPGGKDPEYVIRVRVSAPESARMKVN